MGLLKTMCVVLMVNTAILTARGVSTEQEEQAALLIQKQQQLRAKEYNDQLERERLEAVHQRKTLSSEEVRLEALPIQEGALPSFFIKDITIRGVTQLTPWRVAQLKKDYINRSLSIADINGLVKAITNTYIKKGFVTTRAYIPEQNLKKGHLLLDVKEGYVETIKVVDEKDNSLACKLTFPFIVGKVLNIRDIEQGLKQINRLEGYRASLNLLPSKTQLGYSVIAITKRKIPKKSLRIQYDNTALKPFKLYPNSLSWTLNNRLGIHDSTTIRFSQYNGDTAQNNNSQFLSWSVPFGYMLWSATYSRFEYMNLYKAYLGTQKISGVTETKSLRVHYDFPFRRLGLFALNTGVSVSNPKNYQEDYLKRNSSRKTAVVDVGMTHRFSFSTGFFNTGLTYTHGMDAWGAYRDPATLRERDPRAQFDKVAMEATFQHHETIGTVPVRIQTQLRGQYARCALHTVQQISIGDLYSVRGYRGQSIIGDDGLIVRNDVSAPLTAMLPFGWLQKRAHSTRFYLGADVGYVWSKSPVANANRGKGGLAGVGIGITHNRPGMRVDVLYSVPVRATSFVAKTSGEFYMTVGFSV